MAEVAQLNGTCHVQLNATCHACRHCSDQHKLWHTLYRCIKRNQI